MNTNNISGFHQPEDARGQSASYSEAFASPRRLFDQLVEIAEELCGLNKYSASSISAQLAAQVAWLNHAGFFTSPRLERLLLRLGEQIGRHTTLPSGATDAFDGLHILTTATGTSGDTRFVWRWIQLDSKRRYSVAITRQMGQSIPRQLEESVRSSGGKIHVLDASQADPFRRAERLRTLAASARAVFFHGWPDDVVPSIAFAVEKAIPPVAIVNQSDHSFWLGTGIADLVVELREEGRRLSSLGRGIPLHRSATLPIPIMSAPEARDIVGAKAKLGLTNKTILLSIASSYKYSPLTSPSWQELVLEILRQEPDAVCLLIGPDPNKPYWAKATEASNGQLRVLGQTPDTNIYYQAADIYLDSYPFASNTSLLEAGTHRIPLRGYYPHYNWAEVCCGGIVGLDGLISKDGEPSVFIAGVRKLIQSDAERSALGVQTRARLLAAHGPEGWEKALEKLYSQLLGMKHKLHHSDSEVGTGIDPRLHLLVQQLYRAGGWYVEIAGMAETLLDSLPYGERFQLARRLRQIDNTCSRSLFSPNWVRRFLRHKQAAKR